MYCAQKICEPEEREKENRKGKDVGGGAAAAADASRDSFSSLPIPRLGAIKCECL